MQREGVARTVAVLVEDDGDVRRRWGQNRLAELIDQDAGREAMVDLGVRFGLVSPWTSLVVGGMVGGTGLGMAIVHNLVTVALEGTIDIRSSEGEGTEVVLTLPRFLSGTTIFSSPDLEPTK